MAETRHPIVTTEAFGDFSSLEVPEHLEGFLASRLEFFQADAETIMKRPCWVVVTDETVTDVLGDTLVTRRRPVVSVEDSTPEFTPRISSGGLILLDATWMTGPTSYTVSYTSRLSEERELAVATAIYARAERSLVRAIDEAQGVKSVNEGGYSVPYLDEGWLPGEMETFRRTSQRTSR